MKPSRWNLARLWRRLDLAGAEAHTPEMAEYVQPVALAGDFLAESPFVLPPTAYFGGYASPITNTVDNAFVEVSGAPEGGSMIDFIQLTAVTNAAYAAYNTINESEFVQAPLTYSLVWSGNPLFFNRQEIGPTPSQTQVRFGRVLQANFPPAIGNGAAMERLRGPESSGSWSFENIYVPAGWKFVMLAYTYDNPTYDSLLAGKVRDLPGASLKP